MEALLLEQWIAEAASHGASAHEGRERFAAWLTEPLAAVAEGDDLLQIVGG